MKHICDHINIPKKYVLVSALLLVAINGFAQNGHSRDTAINGITYSYVEQMPEAGYDYQDFIVRNMHYPDSANIKNIEGRVIVKFVVNEDGSISDCKVVRGIGGGCDEEALRVVRLFPKWKPGKQNGKAVKVYYTIPIVFQLTD